MSLYHFHTWCGRSADQWPWKKKETKGFFRGSRSVVFNLIKTQLCTAHNSDVNMPLFWILLPKGFFISIFPLFISDLLCPIPPCVTVLEPVLNVTHWFYCPERTQNWLMQSTQRTRPGNLRRSLTLECPHQAQMLSCFKKNQLCYRTHWEDLLLKKSHSSITANTSKPFLMEDKIVTSWRFS